MAKDESEALAFLGGPFTNLAPSPDHLRRFRRSTELLSYLILCVSKMPFIPPVSIARSVSGLTGKDKPNGAPSVPAAAAAAAAKTKIRREDKGSSVKERLALNLKQLGKKNLPRSHLPVAKGLPAPELPAKKNQRFLPSSDSLPASGSGESLFRTQQRKQVSRHAAKREPEARGRAREEAGFTLTLTPEAVLLLQRRNSERHQRSRRERHPPAPQRHGALTCRADITSIVKISLLNEKHKYDDVEYEEEEEAWRVDERVVLKCTEWLRGLENSPVAVRNGLGGSLGGLKSF